MKGVFLEHLTWKECEEALARFETLVIPVGARMKEHGLHLPLNNDWRMAEYLAAQVTEACAVMTVPTVPFGYYPAFVEYPGSVHLEADVFAGTIEGIVRSFARHGVKKFYVLNTGISTITPLRGLRDKLVAEKLRLEFTDLRQLGANVARELEEQTRGTHADELETSLMLHIAPETVRMALARRDDAADRGGDRGLTPDPLAHTGVYSPTGGWGDPTLATAEKGRRLTEAYVAGLINDVTLLNATR